jgi:membrane-associated phospholipid phosphatase
MTATTHGAARARPTRSRRAYAFARVIAEITGPPVVAAAGLLIVAVRSSGGGRGAAWGSLAAIFAAGLPMAYVAKGVKAGKWSDHHLAERESRTIPLIIAVASVAVGTALLIAVNAPRDLVALVVAMLVGLVVVVVITRWWKVSLHASVAGGFVGILLLLFGPWALVGVPALAIVAWSRTVLQAHTWPQVIIGSAVGFTGASVVFPLAR